MTALTLWPKTREAQQRMDEMRQMIGRRNGDLTPRKVRPAVDTSERTSPLPTSTANEPLRLDGLDKAVESFVFDVDGKLAQAAENQDDVQEGLREISAKLREVRFLHAHSWFWLMRNLASFGARASQDRVTEHQASVRSCQEPPRGCHRGEGDHV